MAEITVISSSLVRMATNGIANSRMELTPWDLRLLLLDPIQRGLLFHNPKPQDLDKTIIPHLKSSLARTLDFFPPLAGRLGTVKNDDMMFFFLDCNNAGVQFTHAMACGVSVSDIENRSQVPEIVSSFFPLNGLLNCEGISNPLLGVQVTELVDGYFIGCTANHSVVDGVSFWHFFNSWSEISRGSDSISKPPIFERWFPSNICNSNRLIPVPPLQPNLQNNFSSAPLQDRFFHFSRESVAKLKAKANSEASTDKISSLQALSAHLWRAVIRARHSSHSPDFNQEISCMLVVGTRSRIPLPDGYFGNALHRARLTTSELELLQQSLGWAALKLNDLVAEQTREAAVRFVDEWVKNPNIVSKGINTFVVSSSPRFNVYGNDFGWGKPAAVRSGKAQKFDGMMTVFPGPECSGGVDVEASLAPLTLLAMGADAEFMEFVTI